MKPALSTVKIRVVFSFPQPLGIFSLFSGVINYSDAFYISYVWFCACMFNGGLFYSFQDFVYQFRLRAIYTDFMQEYLTRAISEIF